MKYSSPLLLTLAILPCLWFSTESRSYPHSSPTLWDYYRVRNAKRSVVPAYQHLCKMERVEVLLETENSVDYYPPVYTEVRCKTSSSDENELVDINDDGTQTCNEGSYHCIQQHATIYLLKKSKNPTCTSTFMDTNACSDSRCWQIEQRTVPSGCECMLPTQSLSQRR